ncbi:restriction endonuclease subunit S [Candidatus Thiosymbion oneisti]|uniref:restriction endonuclease subunit S n=1 Tax=Candidatus Thiosymbion oneisti TaxID=589554 RepID=UPI000B07E248|nr:restriction endonuclease subunit S [Candidatus Thiosymbion oneisti]
MNTLDLLSELPANWQAVPLKSVCQFAVNNVDKHSHEDEVPVRLCNYTDVYKNEKVSPKLDLMVATATKEEIAQFHLDVGDVVITKDSESWNDIGVPAYVEATSEDFICGYHLAFIRPNKVKLDGRYLFRCMQSRPIALQLELEAAGVTRYGIPKGAIGSAVLPLPSFERQRGIADYLDCETAYIDALIAEKERMLALLEEKRATLISQAVTRGLDPDIPLKPSGLDWLGDIPTHWDIERAKNVFSVRDERSETGDEELLTVSHITGVTPRSDKEVYMFKADDMTGYKRCYPNDLVINTLWAWMGAMGVSPLSGIISPDYHVYESKGLLLPEFMELLCRSKPFVAEVNRWSKGVWSSRLRLYPESFFEMRLPIPPEDEQREIVKAVEGEGKKGRELAAALKESMALLKERRSALITAAVTGQIDSREMAA